MLLASHRFRFEGSAPVLARALLLCLGLALPAAVAGSAEGAYPRAPGAADRAPVGVETGHTLDRGKWMFSYRYVRAHKEGYRDGDRRPTLDDVLEEFEVAHRDAQVQQHILTAMYAPHDRVTLMAVLPFVMIDTENVSRVGGVRHSFTTQSRGIGDIEVHGLVRFMRKERQTLHVTLGLSVPSGSISVEDEIDGMQAQLPYSQQLGTGTVGLLPGFTYLGYYERLSWGCQGGAVFQIGRNHKDYKWGSRWRIGGWLARSWGDWLSTSLRLDFDRQNNVRGEDTALHGWPSSPATDPGRQAGSRLAVGPGMNFKIPVPGDPRLVAEMLWPIYQSLDGPQLETDWTLNVGLQMGF